MIAAAGEARGPAARRCREVGTCAGLALALALAAGCGGDGGARLAECDALLATAGKVAACRRVDPAQRRQVRQAARSLEEVLDRLAGAGVDQAPAELVSEVRKTCATQAAELQKVYEKDVPDCVR